MTDLAEQGTTLTRQELAAWRGMLRVHASLLRSMDADLIAAHGIGLRFFYEVLLHLDDAARRRVRMSDLGRTPRSSAPAA